MKKLLFILAFTSFVSSAQVTPLPISTSKETLHGDPMLMLSENTSIEGSKYLIKDWSEGYVILNDSVFTHQNNLLFNQMDGALILKASGGAIKVTDPNVTGFVLNDNENNKKHYFSKLSTSNFEGYATKTKYFQVVSNLGRTNYLIKDIKKYVFDPNRSKGVAANNNLAHKYKEKTTYFLKTKSGKYVKSKLGKKAILKNLSDKSKELKAYIASNKINLNKEHDVVRLLNFYHKL